MGLAGIWKVLSRIAALFRPKAQNDKMNSRGGRAATHRAATRIDVRSLGHAQHALSRASMALTGLGRAQRSEHGRPPLAAPGGSNPRCAISSWNPRAMPVHSRA